MSRENVAVVQRGIDAWHRGDFNTWLTLWHPDIEWFPVITQLVEGQETVYRGIPGMRRFWKDWHEIFDFRFEEIEIRDLGDTVLVLSRVSATGISSGVHLDTPLAMVITFERGLARRTVSYLSHAEALEAVGLEA